MAKGINMLATKSGIDGEIKAKGEIYLYPSFWEKVQEQILQDIVINRIVEAVSPVPELEWYSIRDYDLSEARTDFRIDDFNAEGDVLLVLVRTGSASIKFDSPNADSYNLATYRKMRHSYESVYLTNEAQAGKTLRLLFGKGEWDVEQTIPTVDLEGLLLQENLAQITDPEKLADSIIRAAKIATHAVEAEKIAENAITETKIAPDSIATPHLKANIVTGDKIAAGTITGNLIAANVIATYHLIAGAVTAGKIAADSIRATHYHELRNTIAFQDHDSLDADFPFEMPFEIVSEMTAIVSVKLSFDIKNFRAYATGVPSGGGHTSSSGGGQTSSSTGTPSGGGHTTPSGGGHTTPSGGGHTSSSKSHSHSAETTTTGSHDHPYGENEVPTRYAEGHTHDYWRFAYLSDWGDHHHSISISAGGSHNHTVYDHRHSVSNHTHVVSNHTHPGHTHTVSNHTHVVSDHEHALSFGIYEEEQSPTIDVFLDNGEGYGDSIGSYDSDQLDINITDHVSGAGWKKVKFESTARTRISSIVMVKLDLTA